MQDKRGTRVSINATTWHDNELVNQHIELRLAALIRLGRAQDEKVQAQPGEYLNEVCEFLAGAVASMPAVQRAMSVALQSTDREHCYNTVVRAIAKLFVINAVPLLEKLKPTPAEPPPVFVAPRDPHAN